MVVPRRRGPGERAEEDAQLSAALAASLVSCVRVTGDEGGYTTSRQSQSQEEVAQIAAAIATSLSEVGQDPYSPGADQPKSLGSDGSGLGGEINGILLDSHHQFSVTELMGEGDSAGDLLLAAQQQLSNGGVATKRQLKAARKQAREEADAAAATAAKAAAAATAVTAAAAAAAAAIAAAAAVTAAAASAKAEREESEAKLQRKKQERKQVQALKP